MTTRVAKNSLSWVHDGPVDNCKAAISVSDPKESKVESSANLLNWWADFLKRQLFYLLKALRVRIQTKLF